MNKGIGVLLLSKFQLVELGFVCQILKWLGTQERGVHFNVVPLKCHLGCLLAYKTARGSLKLRSLQRQHFWSGMTVKYIHRGIMFYVSCTINSILATEWSAANQYGLQHSIAGLSHGHPTVARMCQQPLSVPAAKLRCTFPRQKEQCSEMLVTFCLSGGLLFIF